MRNPLASDILGLKESLRVRGIVRLEQFLPPDKFEPARHAVRHRMAQAGIWRDGGWHAEHLRDAPINEGAKYGRQLKGCPEFDELVSDEIPQLVAQLLDGKRTFVGMDVPQPLFTLPNAQTWDVPHMTWHLDAPRLPNCGTPGIQIFTFLESVAPMGGGTLAVAGSHRLLNGDEHIRSKDVKRRLKQHPYFRELMSNGTSNRRRFLEREEDCDGIPLQVIEMSGEPGDVYFVDLRVLHAAALNATNTPRIMLTRRFFLEALRDLLYR